MECNIVKKAKAAMAANDWETANVQWSILRKSDPKDSMGFVQGGITLKNLGRLEDAHQLFDESIARHLNNINNKIQKALLLMDEKQWDDANKLWSIIRDERPDLPAGFLHGGITLIHIEEYNEASILLMKDFEKTDRIRRGRLFDLLSLIDDEKYLNLIWKYLAEEKFDYTQPTVLSGGLYSLYNIDNNLFIKYREKLSKFNLDYYNLLFLGKDKHPNIEYLKKIFRIGDIHTVSRITSSKPIHKHNLKVVQEERLYLESPDKFIREGYQQILEPKAIQPQKVFKRRLNIAVCVSGQLRGYKEAFKGWEFVNNDTHNFDFYCSVWDNIGNKKINKIHIDRVFRPNYASAFLEYTRGLSDKESEDKLPSLFNYFAQQSLVDESSVRDFYNAEKAAVVSEDGFAGKSNQYKMYYMIENCFKLIPRPEDYDLIIRIRPDKQVIDSNIDWIEVLECLDSKSIALINRPIIRGIAGINIDDQFAVGVPEAMQEYSLTFSKVITREYPFDRSVYSGFRPHMTLFLSLLLNDIQVHNINDLSKNLVLGKPIDANELTKQQLINLTCDDLRSKPEYLQAFLRAIDKDYPEIQ